MRRAKETVAHGSRSSVGRHRPAHRRQHRPRCRHRRSSPQVGPEHPPSTPRRSTGRLAAARRVWKTSHTLTGLAEQRGPTERDEHFQEMEAQPPPSPRQTTPQHEDGRRVADAHEDTRHEDDDQDRRPGSRFGHGQPSRANRALKSAS